MRNGKPFIIAAPDSFKGSLSASDAAKNIAAGVAAALPDAEIMTIPAADGGEGTVAALCGDCIRASDRDRSERSAGRCLLWYSAKRGVRYRNGGCSRSAAARR